MSDHDGAGAHLRIDGRDYTPWLAQIKGAPYVWPVEPLTCAEWWNDRRAGDRRPTDPYGLDALTFAIGRVAKRDRR